MDDIASIQLFTGIALTVMSWVYLIIISFREDYAWGFMSVFLPPLSYVYSLFQPGKTMGVLALAFLGWVFILLGLF